MISRSYKKNMENIYNITACTTKQDVLKCSLGNNILYQYNARTKANHKKGGG